MIALTKSMRHKRLAEWYLGTVQVKQGIRKAANNEQSGSAGGFLVPPELQVGIDEAIQEESFFHQHGWVQPMKGKSIDLPSVDVTASAAAAGTSPLWGGFIMYWLSGDGVAPSSQSNPIFENQQAVVHELGGYGYVTNQLMQDGGEPLGKYLETVIGKASAGTINLACFNGTGIGQPLGVVNAPGSSVVSRTTGGTIVATDATNMLAKLLPASMVHSWWVCSPAAFGVLSSLQGFFPALALNTSGDGIRVMVSGTFRGLPIYVTEALPTLGTKGDLILLDPRLCVVTQRTEIEIDWTDQFPTGFIANMSVVRAWWRGDFSPVWRTTATIINGASGISPYVVLNT